MLGLGLIACCKWGLGQPSTLPDIGDWVECRCIVLVVQRLRVNGYLFLDGSSNLRGRGQAWTPWCELDCISLWLCILSDLSTNVELPPQVAASRD